MDSLPPPVLTHPHPPPPPTTTHHPTTSTSTTTTHPPPLQDGYTPLHAAALNGHASVVALLLAIPGVDPLSKDVVRSVEKDLSGRLSCPTPLPSAAGWQDSAGLCE